MKKESRFRRSVLRRGNPVYECRSCGKKTRETGDSESGVELCRSCHDAAGIENEHCDGLHDSNPHPNCPDCQEAK